MLYRRPITLLSLLCFVVLPAKAQVTGLGSTMFENSGAEEAQDMFSRGILLLHSFEYEDAREAFSEARRIDPDFAMAYWGEAMTHNHPIWMQQSTEKARDVLRELAPDLQGRLEKAPTTREKDYLRAAEALYFSEGDKRTRDFAFEEQMASLSARYPDDMDAAAFHALSILGLAHDGRDFELYMRAAAIVEEVFAINPQHPGAAHYLIHSYDDPVHAPLGLRAARTYATIAPDAAHALHMPSHIFTALGMWPEVASANEESFAASDARMQRKGLGVNARSFHARYWLAYAYLQQGRHAEAEGLLKDMISDAEEGDSRLARRHLVSMTISYLVETQRWDSEYARIDLDPEGLSPNGIVDLLFIRGSAALARGDEEKARKAVSELMHLEGAEVGELLQHQLKAQLLELEGNLDGAIDLLETAAEMEAARPMEFGPPKPAKPTYERLGEYYLKAGKGAKAMKAFETSLARAPGRSLSFIGMVAAAKMKGDKDAHKEATARLKKNWKKADPSVTKTFPIPD